MATFVELIAICLIFQLLDVVYCNYYSLDGSANNQYHQEWGTPNRPYRRLPNEHHKLSYSDGFQINAQLPNPRIISNAIGQIPKVQSKHAKYSPLSGISWVFSKTVSQELCKTKTEPTPNTFYPINVPPCDWYLDYNCTNTTRIQFWRSPLRNTTNSIDNQTYPTPVNTATAFIDLHWIYGLNTQQQQQIRVFKHGLIKTPMSYAFNTSDELVAAQLHSTAFATNINNSITDFYAASDRRNRSFAGINASISGYTATECPFFAGEATPNTLIGHLWKLNHNRIARELAQDTGSTDDEYLFQEARVRQIATVQHIIYTEYLPLFLAYPVINDIEYNSSIDPTVSAWFCGLAHRYSHPAAPNKIPFAGYHNHESEAIYGGYINETISSISIREAVTYPCMGIDSIKNNNQSGNVYVESMLGGLMLESENLVSPKHNEFLRSFLPLRGTEAYADLFAIDIFRTRDWGMPSYNDARELFELERINSWQNLTDNEWYLEILPQLYDDVNDLDAYIGGLIEKVEADYTNSRNGSGHIGPLFAAILRDQYYRAAAGDRFFYAYNETLRDYTEGITLSNIIELNTNLKELSTDIFTADAKNIVNTEGPSSATKSMALLDGVVYFEWAINDNDGSIIFTFKLFCGTDCEHGWLAIGFGEGQYMKGKDIIKTNFNQNRPTNEQFIVLDAYCPTNKWIPLPDPTGQDVTFLSGSFDNIAGIITFSVERPINKHGADGFFAYDYPIKEGEHCCIIVAYNLDSEEGKHSTNHRIPVVIDWRSGDFDTKQLDTVTTVRLTHGLLMIGLFGFCYPISAFIAHYLKHYPWARQSHILSAKLGLPTALTSAAFALSTVPEHNTTLHASLGITCLILLGLQAGIGFFIGYWLDNYQRALYYDKIKCIHLFTALCILMISPVTMWYGWNTLGLYQFKVLLDWYTCEIWYIFVVLIIICGEIYFRIWPKLFNVKKKVLSLFNMHNYHIFKWSEIGEKVSAGAAWVVIDGLIYDVSSWLFAHPGGRRVLLHCFGTDCTEFFNGLEPVGEAHGNIKHAHSDYAKQQLINMIVGEVYTENNKKRDITSRQATAFENNLLFDACGDKLETNDSYTDEQSLNISARTELEKYNDPRKLTVITLINKEVVSKLRNSQRKIVLFEFDYDVLVHRIGFDGDYILLHEVDKNAITRAYTPINPKFILANNYRYYNKNVIIPQQTQILQENRLFLMIRIYRKGRMSKILNKLQIGHTIRITGPFRREKLLPPLRNHLKYDIIPSKEWIDLWLVKLLNNSASFQETELAKQQLKVQENFNVNKYWRRVVLICGGTGVTPMFNMIQHHLDKQDDDIRVNLIWHNRTLNDVCFEQQLKDYKLNNLNRFWIDLKFDVDRINMSLDVNVERLKWARIHTKKWLQTDMVRMVKYFFSKGMPINMAINSQKSSRRQQTTGRYWSVEVDTDGRTPTDVTVNTEEEEKIDSSDTLNEIIVNLSNESDDEKAIELQTIGRLKPNETQPLNNDIIILSGPRPFVDNIRNTIFAKAKDLEKYINVKKQLICLD